MNKLDFPDFFLPALVKDLRQSLRSTSSIITAVLAPCLLAITLCGESAYSFWSVVAIVLFLLSIVAFRSVKQDIGKHATNFLILTGQTSWRLVAGKWLSVVVQMGLLNLLLIPFVALAAYHYDQPFELFCIRLLILNAASIVLVSIQMFMAGMPFFYRVVGIIVGLMFFVHALTTCWLMADAVYGAIAAWDAASLKNTGLPLLVSAADTLCLVMLFLSLTRRFYASPSENCALPLRQLEFIVLAITGITVLASPALLFSTSQFIFSALYCLFASWMDLTLPGQALPSHRENLTKHPLRIRPSFLSMPGWIPAYIWGVILLVLHAALLYRMACVQPFNEDSILGQLIIVTPFVSSDPAIHLGGVILTALSILYTVTVPLIIINPMRRWLQDNGPIVYALILLAIAFVCAPILASIPDLHSYSPIVAWIPGLCLSGSLSCWWQSAIEHQTCLAGTYFPAQLASTVIACTILGIQAACSRSKK